MTILKGLGFDSGDARNRLGVDGIDTISFAPPITAEAGLTVTTGGADITGNSSVTGNLTVSGALISRSEEQVLVKDNFLDLNFGYGTNAYEQTGLTFNYQATASGANAINASVNNVVFTAGSGADRAKFTIADTVIGAAAFTDGDLIQIADTTNAVNDGIYVVNSCASVDGVTTITIKSANVGGDTPDAKFALTQFTSETEDTAGSGGTPALVITGLNVMALRSSSLGVLQSATGATDSSFAAANWEDVGAGTVTLQDAYDNGQSIVVTGLDLIIDDTADNTNDFNIGAANYFANFSTKAVDTLFTAPTTSGSLTLTSGGTGGGDVAIMHANSGASSIVLGHAGGSQLAVNVAGVNASTDFTMDKATGSAQTISKDGSAAAGDNLVVQVTGLQASSLVLQSEGSGTDALKLATITNGGSIDIDSAAAIDIFAAGTFSIDGTGNSNVSAAAGILTVSTTGSGNLVVSAVDTLDLDGAVVSIDSAAAMTIAAVGTLDVDGAGVTIDSSTTMGITATGNLAIDSSALSIDSVDTTNLTMTTNASGATKVLTIAALNTNVDPGSVGKLSLNATTSVVLQNAGADRITLGGTNVVFDTPIQANANIQADSTAGFKFGVGGIVMNDFIDDDTFTTGVDGFSIASSESIKAYVDTHGVTTYSNILSLIAATGGITVGDVVAINTSGEAIKADASLLSTGNVIGFALSTENATDPVDIAQVGSLGGFASALTAGSRYYLSETAGGVTDVAPDGTNTVVVQVGYAITDSIMAIAPMFITENN